MDPVEFVRDLLHYGVRGELTAVRCEGGMWVVEYLHGWADTKVHVYDLCLEHDWHAQPGEPPYDACFACGAVRR